MVVEDARENYPHIYPRWDIAFACVFDYTDSQEDCPVGLAREQLLGTRDYDRACDRDYTRRLGRRARHRLSA